MRGMPKYELDDDQTPHQLRRRGAKSTLDQTGHYDYDYDCYEMDGRFTWRTRQSECGASERRTGTRDNLAHYAAMQAPSGAD